MFTMLYRGQPARRLTLPTGDSCIVALHGAQVLSWRTADGIERLYLSPQARFDGRSAIRGGVPICWPQFNQRGALAKHGFVRTLAWQAAAQRTTGASAQTLVLVLRDSDTTRSLWPHAFCASLAVTLAPGTLRVALAVDNTGSRTWSFTAALHSYLRVDEVTAVRLEGLQGAQRWDAVRNDRRIEAAPHPAFGVEFDRIYAAPAAPLRLVQTVGALTIAQSASCTETVVWNPGPALTATLLDVPNNDWRHLLCVEAARIEKPVMLAPGASWKGWQELSAVAHTGSGRPD